MRKEEKLINNRYGEHWVQYRLGKWGFSGAFMIK